MENNTNPKPSSVKDALLNFYAGQGHTLDDSVADQLLEEYKGREVQMFEETFKLYNFEMNDTERAMIKSLIEPQKKKGWWASINRWLFYTPCECGRCSCSKH